MLLGQEEPEEAEGGDYEHSDGKLDEVGVPADEELWPGEYAIICGGKDIREGGGVE